MAEAGQGTQAEVTGIGNMLVAMVAGDTGEEDESERRSIGRGRKGRRCSRSASAYACGTSSSATPRGAPVVSSAGLVRHYPAHVILCHSTAMTLKNTHPPGRPRARKRRHAVSTQRQTSLPMTIFDVLDNEPTARGGSLVFAPSRRGKPDVVSWRAGTVTTASSPNADVHAARRVRPSRWWC